MNKPIKYILIGLSVIILVILGASFYMLNYSLRPDETHRRDIAASYEHLFQKYPEVKVWVDSLRQADAIHDLFITNKEGDRLHALYVRAATPTPKTAVIIHGYDDNAIGMLMIGYMYSRQLRFNVLLPDLYGHGESGGSGIRMGWKDRLDAGQWTYTADSLYGGNTEMVVHGISMGAATTMMLSGEPQPPFMKCFVEDCGYTSVWDEFTYQLDDQFGLPPFPLMYTTSWLSGLLNGWDFKEASAIRQVRKCKLPMLFIHGDADTYVPTWMVYPLYEAKPKPKELWIVPGAAHADSYRDFPQEYTEHVEEFVGKYIR